MDSQKSPPRDEFGGGGKDALENPMVQSSISMPRRILVIKPVKIISWDLGKIPKTSNLANHLHALSSNYDRQLLERYTRICDDFMAVF